jgi:hypothetical protein
VTQWLPDASCLIEPEPGLWLLLIDATVFEPRDGVADGTRKRAFHDPATAGWDAVLRVKPFLIDWIADVMVRGRAAGKLVLAVSHYPVLPPLPALQHLLPGSALARRSPGPDVAARLAAAGLRLHVGGHLHVNARSAGALIDVSLPATCAFPAAFGVIAGDADGVTLRVLPLGDLAPDPVLARLMQADGAPVPADFGQMLHAQYRARLLTRRLPRELPPGVWDRVQVARFADMPLAELLCDAVMLAEGGALALPYLVPGRIALLRRMATDRALASDPLLGPCFGDLARLLDQVLPAMGDAGDTVMPVS